MCSGLYLLNLLVANSPITTNDREKIDVGDLAQRGAFTKKEQAGLWDGLTDIVTNPRRLFEGDETNRLHAIFGMIVDIYVKLTWHT